MKSLLIVLALSLSVSSAFAQRRPRIPGTRIPIPRVEVGVKCGVVAIDNWHRVYRSYSGRRDIVTGQCSSALRQCRNDLGYRRGIRCVERNGRGW